MSKFLSNYVQYNDYDIFSIVATKKSKNDDKILIDSLKDGLILALADGATGIGLGHLASEEFINSVEKNILVEDVFSDENILSSFFMKVDEQLTKKFDGDANTTGIILCAKDNKFIGSSVGDSEVWLFTSDKTSFQYTWQQNKKPRIGSGCRPGVNFEMSSVKKNDIILLASDCLFGYASNDFIKETIYSSANIEEVGMKLYSHIIKTYDGLPDDFSLIICKKMV